MEEKSSSSFRVTVIVSHIPPQLVEDMELNAQEYIKDDINDNNLYIESIEAINV